MKKDELDKYVEIINNFWYDEIIKKFNPEIEDWIIVTDGGYQGDYYIAGKKNNKIYYIQGAFGSCTLCDWLESICYIIHSKKYEKRDFTNDELTKIKDFITTMKKLMPIGKDNITTKEDVQRFLELEKNNVCFGTESLVKLEQEIMKRWFK